MSNTKKALLAAGLVALIYGATYPIGKGITPVYIKPYGLTLIRVIGAAVLFWIVGFLGPKEKIKRNDFLWIFLTSLCGASLNMIFLFKGLSITNPINVSVIVLMTPIFVCVNSYIFLKDKINNQKLIGILIGLIGAISIVLFSKNKGVYSSSILGDVLALGSPICYSFYLIILARLTKKYHVLTITKWSLLFGVLVVFPFGFKELAQVQWTSFSLTEYLSVVYIVVGTSFLAILLTVYALKHLSATTFSVFMYLQPVFTILMILMFGIGTINSNKILGMTLVIAGCYLVVKPSKIKILTDKI